MTLRPTLRFEFPFDERAQLEAHSRGYLSNVKVQQPDGSVYPVFFYDCIRLAQDLEYEVSVGRICLAEVGMIIVPEITLENMTLAVNRLTEIGFFSSFKPLANGSE